jgi:hypothetical protein
VLQFIVWHVVSAVMAAAVAVVMQAVPVVVPWMQNRQFASLLQSESCWQHEATRQSPHVPAVTIPVQSVGAPPVPPVPELDDDEPEVVVVVAWLEL